MQHRYKVGDVLKVKVGTMYTVPDNLTITVLNLEDVHGEPCYLYYGNGGILPEHVLYDPIIIEFNQDLKDLLK